MDVLDGADELKGVHKANEIRLKSSEDSLKEYEEKIQQLIVEELNHQKAIDLLKKIADDRTNSAVEILQNTVNWALENIQLEQRFEIILEVKDRTDGKVMSINLVDLDLNKTRTLKHQSGTAVRQIVSFLLQMTIISLSGARKVVILDEVLSGLQDKETIAMFGQIIVALAENDGFQFFMVEHKSELLNVAGITQVHLQLGKNNNLEVAKIVENKIDSNSESDGN